MLVKMTVLENLSCGLIFGLDNMRCLRIKVDLQANAVYFPDHGDKEVKFLSEGEIVKFKNEHEELEF